MGQGLKEQRGPWCRYLLYNNPDSTRHRYSPGSRRRAVGDHARMSEASQVGMVPTYDVRSTASRYSSCSTSNTTIHAFRPENNVGASSQPMNGTRVLCLKQRKVTLLPQKSTMKIQSRLILYELGTAVIDTRNFPYPTEEMEDAHSFLEACYGCSRLKLCLFPKIPQGYIIKVLKCGWSITSL